MSARHPHRWSRIFVCWVLATLAVAGIPRIAGAEVRASHLNFERLDLRNGLSQNTVTALLQDQRGFLWVGTQNGLNRYDGYEFDTFQHEKSDSLSLSNSYVLSLIEDDERRLWVGTNDGLCLYDRGQESFRSVPLDASNPHALRNGRIRTLAVDSDGILWVGTEGGGLHRVDPDTGLVEPFEMAKSTNEEATHPVILALLADRNGQLWVGARDGLFRLDPRKGRLAPVDLGVDGDFDPLTEDINVLTQDSQGQIWVGTLGAGLFRLAPDGRVLDHFRHDPTVRTSLSGDFVQSVYEDTDRTVWVGTRSGLNARKADDTAFQRTTRGYQVGALPDNNLTLIYEDRSGVLWIGTATAGLVKHVRQDQRFPCIRFQSDDPSRSGTNVIRSIYESPDGLLWVGTEGDGLICYNRRDGEVAQFQSDDLDENSLIGPTVRAIAQDSSGRLWLGADGEGLTIFDPSNKGYERIAPDPSDSDGIPMGSVRALLPDPDGGMWVGLFGGGLHYYDPSERAFTRHYRAADVGVGGFSDYVYTLSRDREGCIWMGGESLVRFDPAHEQWHVFEKGAHDPQQIDSNFILHIEEARDGQLWIATTNGLFRLDPTTQVFTHYTEEDGLPDNVVYACLETDDGELWMSTNQGIAALRPESGEIRYFDTSHGLQSSEFNGGAYFESPTGELFFGGIDGLNAFHPDRIGKNQVPPEVVLTDFQLSNASVAIGQDFDGRPILQRSITETRSLELTHRQNKLSFEFAALHFVSPQSNRYAYRLVGFEDDWIEVEGRHFATYTSLPPGNYEFQVKAANNDGVWNPTPTTLALHIDPPLWMTAWFRALVILMAVGSIWMILYVRTRSIAQRNLELEARVRERTIKLQNEVQQRQQAQLELEEARDAAEAASRAKGQFLANMSHEIRTPMNGILGMTQLLLDTDLDEEQLDYGRTVHHSAELLLSVINDILDFSKIEAGRLDLETIGFEPARTIAGVRDLLVLKAEEKGLEFRWEIDPRTPRVLKGDPLRIRQVLLNLLSNAIKFTEKGTITLAVHVLDLDEDSAHVAFCVRDTGIGIPAEKVSTLFDSFSQVDESTTRRYGGTGLGLAISKQLVEMMGGRLVVDSELGRGTEFRAEVRFPIGSVGDVDDSPLVGNRKLPDSPVSDRRRVLLTEDNPVNQKLASRILEKADYQVEVANNGQEALEALAAGAFDIVLMDVQMPVMDGFEATKAIREGEVSGLNPQIPVIALTAHAMRGDRQKCLIAGMDDYVTKPIHRDTLLETIERHLNKKPVAVG